MYTAGLTGYLPLDLVIENGNNSAIIKCTMMQLAQQCTLGNHTELYTHFNLSRLPFDNAVCDLAHVVVRFCH